MSARTRIIFSYKLLRQFGNGRFQSVAKIFWQLFTRRTYLMPSRWFVPLR